jgi:diguanylate cyclase (GGDEF)-like protein
LLDLDRFKSVNDTYGHVLGDQVLLQIGRLLRQRFRPYDLRCRWGGEEFVLLFPGERVSTARELATRLLAEVRAVEFESDDGRRFTVTFTAGVAGVPSDGTSLQELLATADERLYAGKAAGRARVVSS